ncbi:protein spaetzle-like [Tribolium madens]|uniref:protein spaetzle-like n=1 Tax=Tribolium madens TaxID=41895 RepID=UPI001CF746F5|nr:protein spaetzle-like [Tribolium madens]
MWVKCVYVYVYFMTMKVFFIHGFPSRKRIIFPNSLEEQETFVPKCSGNRTFCEDVENYPVNKFYEILKNTTYEEAYFIPQSVAQEESIKNRKYKPTEFYICDSHIQIQYPRVAYNVKNEWKYVYNFDKYKQGVKTEECVGETACRSFGETPAVRTKCVQKYSDILLLVADEDGKPVWDLFWFPSACLCAYEPIINFNRV